MPITAITHAQYSYDIRPPTVNPNPGGPTVNTTADVASNSTLNVQQQNSRYWKYTVSDNSHLTQKQLGEKVNNII